MVGALLLLQGVQGCEETSSSGEPGVQLVDMPAIPMAGSPAVTPGAAGDTGMQASPVGTDPGGTATGTEQPGAQPDTEQPDAEQPGAEQPDTEQPDTEEPDTEEPDTEEPDPALDLEPFSFFVTSLEIMRELSGSQDGFGGGLGGLTGADSICQQAAERVGFGAKTWRAFLSATDGGDGQPVHAIERIGEGPWYDRNGRLIAEDLAGLLQERPDGDPQTVNDLPNEFGEGLQDMGDTHDVMTATNRDGQLDSTDPANTCNDWTSTTAVPIGGGRGEGGGLRLGHSWPAGSGMSWTTVHSARSCAAGVNLIQNGGGDGSSVGAGGGWGAIYCFALQP